MNTARHAAPRLSIILPAIAAGIGAFTAVVGTLVAFFTVRVAQRVVTPAVRVADVGIVDVDARAQTISLTETPDTVLPGRYGLFVSGSESYLKVGAVLGNAGGTVRRKLLTEVDDSTKLDELAAFSGWYFTHPEELGLAFDEVLIETPVGPAPAWFFPADVDRAPSRCVVAVHGRGTTRAEVLRAVPTLIASGYDVLCVSYRNDGVAPQSASGTYGLGATEWRDVDAAVSWAMLRGAPSVVLMGWSMGGAIVLQTALETLWHDRIDGIILESPVVDWRLVLGFQARQLRVPPSLAALALESLTQRWSSRMIRGGDPISLNDLDIVARADELTTPVLILHSEDDGFVPDDGSVRLAQARPDLVRIERFAVARHTKLWNYDERRWTGAISAWLAERNASAVSEVR